MRFIFTITCKPVDDDDNDLDMSEVQRFGNMMDIAVSGASSDCLLHAELEPVTMLP